MRDSIPALSLIHIWIPVVLILAAGVFGMMNEYFGWLSFLLHAAYLIGIGVMTVVIGGIFRFAQKNETIKKGVQYFVNYVTDGAPYYHFIIGLSLIHI